MTTIRLLPYSVADGPSNMAADEALLEMAVAGGAVLRFYGWSEPTVSLGYFQAQAVRASDPRLAALPFVRRPTGGATLVHHLELTYAMAVASELVGGPRDPRARSTRLDLMHRVIGTALAGLGVEASASPSPQVEHAGQVLCFHQFAGGDLLVGASKITGSAQRKHRGAVLQHGAILLEQSPHTPSLPGIFNLTARRLEAVPLAAAIANEWAHYTGWRVQESDWSEAEMQRVQQLRQAKYCQMAWNCKR
jgi:lipoyl(octanoyl) transferase